MMQHQQKAMYPQQKAKIPQQMAEGQQMSKAPQQTAKAPQQMTTQPQHLPGIWMQADQGKGKKMLLSSCLMLFILRHFQCHQVGVNILLCLSKTHVVKKFTLTEELLGYELENKGWCMLKAEELNGLVCYGVISKSIELL